jgi:hypothetical protein
MVMRAVKYHDNDDWTEDHDGYGNSSRDNDDGTYSCMEREGD